MSSSTNHKDLFRVPAAADKLALFQLLYEAGEINSDLALALLKVIHGELGTAQPPDRSVYKRYAHAIQALRYNRAEMLKQIVEAWRAGRPVTDAEWLSAGRIK